MELNDAEMAELKAKFEQTTKIKEVLASYFEKEELEVGVVISVLMTMLIDVMEASGTPPHHAILMFGTLVTKTYDGNEEDEDEEGVAQWAN